MTDIMRKEPRVLSEEQKESMYLIKQIGEQFYNLTQKIIDDLPLMRSHLDQDKVKGLLMAQNKIEEAVMWAVKGITS